MTALMMTAVTAGEDVDVKPEKGFAVDEERRKTREVTKSVLLGVFGEEVSGCVPWVVLMRRGRKPAPNIFG